MSARIKIGSETKKDQVRLEITVPGRPRKARGSVKPTQIVHFLVFRVRVAILIASRDGRIAK